MSFIKMMLAAALGAMVSFIAVTFMQNSPNKGQNTAQKKCPEGSLYLSTINQKKVCELSGTYTKDMTLSADFYWALKGEVNIGEDNAKSMTLTIEPGTTLFGSSGPDFLLISRGSKIYAKGTKLLPIIFTSAQDVAGRAGLHDRGAWGGLVLSGRAPTNAGDEEVFEFSKTGRKFGGNDIHDSSGILKYVLVKYAGYEVAIDRELNGISFGGVGDGTMVDYIEVYNNADDGIEMWGGTVNLKHVVLIGNGDDNIDVDHGYQGKMQYVYVKQTDVISYDPRGVESDGMLGNHQAKPKTELKLANFELEGTHESDAGIMLRRGSDGLFINGVIHGFEKACLAVRDRESIRKSPEFFGVTLKKCKRGPFSAKGGVDSSEVERLFLDNNHGNTIIDSKPKIASIKALLPDDTFFDDATFIGAYTKEDDWRKGWTVGVE